MKRFLIFLISGLLLNNITAQSIKGKVLDNENVPIDFATVVAQTLDSVFIGSVMTDENGMFSIDSNIEKYRLFIQHLLYDQKVIELSSFDVGSIILDEKDNLLSEVIVKGEYSAIKAVNGRLTYDINRLVENKSVNNVYESLLYLPGISEDKDAGITLAGANNLTIIINGKPSTMTSDQLITLLKNTPPSRVESAEIMYNTPPQYRVRGASINLILKDADEEKLQGQISTRYDQKHYAEYTTGTSLLYGNSKLSVDILYSLEYRHSMQKMDLYSLHHVEGQTYTIDQFDNGSIKKLAHNIRVGAEYSISDKDRLNVEYTSQIIPKSHSEAIAIGTVANSVNNKKATSPIQMHNVGIDYKAKFGTNVGINYTLYKNHTLQNFVSEQEFMSSSTQDINRAETYINQTHNLGKSWEMSYGVSFAYASDRSKQIYETIEGEDMSNLNTTTHLKEYTYGAYAGVSKSFSEKLSANVNFEIEKYKNKQVSEWSVYPTMNVTYAISPTHILQLGVSSDKDYPSFWEMSNSIGYVSAYSEIHGNPSLKPHKSYNSQLTYILNRKYSVTAYYNYVDDYFVQLPYQAPDRLKLIYKTTNFDYKSTVGIAVNIPFGINPVFNSQLLLNGFYNKEKNEHFHSMSFNKNKLIGFIKLDNTINISSKPNIKMELNGTYLTKNMQGYGDISSIWKFDAGAKWTFAKDKAELSLKANDIFNRWQPKLDMRYATQNLKMDVNQDSRNVSLSFIYKFGGYKSKQTKEVNTSRFGQ